MTGKTKTEERPLRGKFPGGKVIYAKYKGKEYKAWLKRNGGIRFKNNIYDTPTGAAKVIIERGAVNGWNFWKYKDKSGNLVSFCGLYCADCPAYTQSIANLAADLHKELNRNKLEKVAPLLAKVPQFSAFKHYQKFDELLANMMKMKCVKPCRAGGGSPDCKIRKCVKDKALDGCWQCADFLKCKTLKLLEKYGDVDKTYLKNLRKIKKIGPAAFVKSKRA